MDAGLASTGRCAAADVLQVCRCLQTSELYVPGQPAEVHGHVQTTDQRTEDEEEVEVELEDSDADEEDN
jgi:hypothetical protein